MRHHASSPSSRSCAYCRPVLPKSEAASDAISPAPAWQLEPACAPPSSSAYPWRRTSALRLISMRRTSELGCNSSNASAPALISCRKAWSVSASSASLNVISSIPASSCWRRRSCSRAMTAFASASSSLLTSCAPAVLAISESASKPSCDLWEDCAVGLADARGALDDDAADREQALGQYCPRPATPSGYWHWATMSGSLEKRTRLFASRSNKAHTRTKSWMCASVTSSVSLFLRR
mmetsp:Transcript_37609/g.99384  ORF Transcript_37609/g.99384 Transcript_37609/m.99384 type:complete len:236 (-) Transcript_37609:775-1482(-)